MRIHFTVDRRAEGFTISATTDDNATRLLRENLTTPTHTHRALQDILAGALIAGATVSYPTDAQIKAMR